MIVAGACISDHMWRPEDNSVQLILFFQLFVGSEAQTQLPGLGAITFIALSHLVNAKIKFLIRDKPEISVHIHPLQIIVLYPLT